MEPCDAVKLVYQSVFGGGHLIPDPAGSLARLEEEYARTPQSSGPLWEPLGNGAARVHLARLDAWGVSPEELNRWFARSAEGFHGTQTELLAGLEELRRGVAAGLFSFSLAALEEYLAAYQAEGCPPVSHSPAYRAAYRPAYRAGLCALLPEALQTTGASLL